MNAKQKLNNEIILCRGAVRQAKVAVTRKLIKCMKILKSCKKENVKEKKLRKSERLFQKVQIIKKLKLDNVTKFALTNDLQNYIPSDNEEKNVMALLGKYKSIAQKVEKIKSQFSDWETEIPELLDAMAEKRSALKQGRHSVQQTNFSKSEYKNYKSEDKIFSEGTESENEEKSDNESLVKDDKDNINDSCKLVKEIKPDFQIDKKPDKRRKSLEAEEEKPRKKSVKVELPEVKIEKVSDPFFIGKEMVAPKLLSEDVPEMTEDKPLRNTFYGKGMSQKTPLNKKKDFGKMTFRVKEPEHEDKLHPSWAAKKVKLIKPFQGKKIKFSED